MIAVHERCQALRICLSPAESNDDARVDIENCRRAILGGFISSGPSFAFEAAECGFVFVGTLHLASEALFQSAGTPPSLFGIRFEFEKVVVSMTRARCARIWKIRKFNFVCLVKACVSSTGLVRYYVVY
jgi:hypothetical protein